MNQHQNDEPAKTSANDGSKHDQRAGDETDETRATRRRIEVIWRRPSGRRVDRLAFQDQSYDDSIQA